MHPGLVNLRYCHLFAGLVPPLKLSAHQDVKNGATHSFHPLVLDAVHQSSLRLFITLLQSVGQNGEIVGALFQLLLRLVLLNFILNNPSTKISNPVVDDCHSMADNFAPCSF